PVTATASLFTVLAALLSRLAWPEGATTGALSRPSGADRARPARNSFAGKTLSQGAILVAAAAVGFFLVVRPYQAGCVCQEGDALLPVAPADALLCHELAVAIDAGRDVLWIKLATSAVEAARLCPDAAQRQGLLRRARRAAERARWATARSSC